VPGATVMHLPDGAAEQARAVRELPVTLRAAAARGESLVVLPSPLVAHPSAVADLVESTSSRSSLVAGVPGQGVRGLAVVVVEGVVRGARLPGAVAADGELVAPGAVRVVPADADAVADTLDAALGALGEPEPPTAAWDDLVTLALVRSGAVVGVVRPEPLTLVRPAEPEAAAAALAATDEHALRLRRSSRADDGFYSTFVVRPMSRRVTAVALRLGLTPNVVTVVSLLIGLAAAWCFALGSYGWLLAGAVLLQVSLVVDCVDGEVARYTRRFSALGGWLDAVGDRVKEFAVYAGLAAGVLRGGDDVWWLASAVLALQAVRHMVDFAFWVVERVARAPHPVPVPVTAAGPTAASSKPADETERGGVAALSARTGRSSALTWAKRVVIMPVGERWLLLSVCTALGRPVLALALLLVLGLVALLYMAAGRLGRSLAWNAAVTSSPETDAGLAALADAGPLLAAAVPPLARPRGRSGWLVPPVLLAVELAAVLVTVQRVAPGAMPWAYLAVAALAFRSYDLATRQRLLGDGRSPRFAAFALGVEVRALVVPVAAAIGGAGRISTVLVVLAAWVLLVTVWESAAAWRAAEGSLA